MRLGNMFTATPQIEHSVFEIFVPLNYIDEPHFRGQDDWLTLKIVVLSPVDGWRD